MCQYLCPIMGLLHISEYLYLCGYSQLLGTSILLTYTPKVRVKSHLQLCFICLHFGARNSTARS